MTTTVTPRQWTLPDLRGVARRRADMENSDFVDDDELDDYLNEGISELYDLLVTHYEDYFINTEDITLVSGTASYAVDNSLYKILRVFYKDSNNYRWEMERFDLGDYANWYDARILPVTTGEHYRYRLMDRSIYIYPTPQAAGTVEIWFAPSAPHLSTDVATLSYTFVNGWEEYVVNHAAIAMLRKEESDFSGWQLRQQELRQRIINAASTRDAAKPSKVRDAFEPRRTRGRW